jgi:hypothetical protein
VSAPELSMTDYERGVAAGRVIERAAVVAWLRRMMERQSPWPEGMDQDAYSGEVMCILSDRIERGEYTAVSEAAAGR